MKTNDLKKGARVKLRNNWEAIIRCNKRGNIRLAEVSGDFKETGSIYSHDMVSYYDKKLGQWLPIQHTKQQLQLLEAVRGIM